MPIDDLTALGDALRAARKEKNLTQEQLADESHVSTKQIADIEKARRNPSYLILKALAKVVHLSLPWRAAVPVLWRADTLPAREL